MALLLAFLQRNERARQTANRSRALAIDLDAEPLIPHSNSPPLPPLRRFASVRPRHPPPVPPRNRGEAQVALHLQTFRPLPNGGIQGEESPGYSTAIEMGKVTWPSSINYNTIGKFLKNIKSFFKLFCWKTISDILIIKCLPTLRLSVQDVYFNSKICRTIKECLKLKNSNLVIRYFTFIKYQCCSDKI